MQPAKSSSTVTAPQGARRPARSGQPQSRPTTVRLPAVALLAWFVAVVLALAGCSEGAAPTPDGTSTSEETDPVTEDPTPSDAPSADPAPADPGATALVAGVSADGRFLVDEAGAPLLLRAEAIWSVMQTLTAQEIDEHLELRASQGFNGVIMHPFPWSGRPTDSRSTVDGLEPFDETVATLDEAYWQRFDAILATANRLGITVFIAPIGMTWGFEENGYDYDEDLAGELGEALGARYKDTPGIVWMLGMDYDEVDWSTYDPMMMAFVDGLRAAGDQHLTTVHLFNPSTSHDNVQWRGVSQIELAYTYQPTYATVLRAYGYDTGPVLLIEGNYEGENNEGGPETTNETLRRQDLWTLTSGGVGVTYGERHVWQFIPPWQDMRVTDAIDQQAVAVDVFRSVPWWTLVPDADGTFLTGGQGEDVTTGTQEGGFADVLESDLATAAISADGSLAVVYVPTARTITLDVSRLAPGVRAVWVDPVTGERQDTELAESLTTPGENADGDEDWLLVLEP